MVLVCCCLCGVGVGWRGLLVDFLVFVFLVLLLVVLLLVVGGAVGLPPVFGKETF